MFAFLQALNPAKSKSLKLDWSSNSSVDSASSAEKSAIVGVE